VLIGRAESEASPLPVYCTSSEGFTLAHQTVGYLTSDYTRATDIGTQRCPWKIMAQVRTTAATHYPVSYIPGAPRHRYLYTLSLSNIN